MKKIAARISGVSVRKFPSISRISTWLVLSVGLALAATPAARATIASSMVIDEATGRVIQAYRVDAPHPPASLTKMMTLYLVFEALESRRISLSSRVTISPHASYQGPSKLYLQAGQEVSVENLILATAVKSANDAAAALAEYIGRSEPAFAARMTAKARELGMTRSTFRNASGLPAAGQYTTSRDMAILARAIGKRFPQYAHYLGRRQFAWGERVYMNTNRLLHTNSEIVGGKTGFTRASGYNLVTVAQRNGQRAILVVLGGRTSAQRYRHASTLLAGMWRGRPQRDEVLVSDRAPPPAAAPAITTARTGFSLISRAEASPTPRVADRASVAFAIQIGNYAKYTQARSMAQKAMAKVPASYRKGASIAVVVQKSGRKRVYSARLVGFTHGAATQTCRYLSRARQRCHTLSYATTTAALPLSPSTYGIELGNFRNKAQAQRAVKLAQARVPASARLGARGTVVAEKNRRGTTYEARLTGFSKIGAAQACAHLERRGQECDTFALVPQTASRND